MSQQSLDEALTDAPTTEQADSLTTPRPSESQRDVLAVSDETVTATVGQDRSPSFEVPVEIGEFTHHEVPNDDTTKWKRVWGEPTVDDYPHVTTEVAITTATTEHWKVSRSHNTYEVSSSPGGPVATFRRMQGRDVGQAIKWNVVSSETLADGLPDRETALQVAIDYMQCASTLTSIVPPGLSEAKAKAYCELYHPDHPVADLTVTDQNKLLEREDPDADDPIQERLDTMLEDGLYEYRTKPAEDVMDDCDSMMSAFREIESWQSKGFEVDVRMPATHSVILRHPEHGEKFKIEELSRRGRPDKYRISATVRGEYVTQSLENAPTSIAVAVEKVNRLIQAEIGNARYYNR